MNITDLIYRLIPKSYLSSGLGILLTTILSVSTAHAQQSAPLVSIPSQNAFFDTIQAYCGKAFEGKVTIDSAAGAGFADKRLVMHVRQCSDTQIHIPFHVGENASRTWILTKTGSGLSLKHDHRKKDGTDDPVTMYGGHTVDKGWPQVQSFPADVYSKELFVKSGLPQSVSNTWQMYVYPDKFTYRLVRQAREFAVEFDLTEAVAPPDAPWGYNE